MITAICEHGKTLMIKKVGSGVNQHYVTKGSCDECDLTNQPYVGSLYREHKQ